jgi:hypothetical protein
LQLESRLMMTNESAESLPCPYCGGTGGNHVWAGAGGCPGLWLPLGPVSPASGLEQGQYGVSDTDMRILAELRAIRDELKSLKQLILERSR